MMMEEKNVLFEKVEWEVCRKFMKKVEKVLKGRKID
jgi:flavorubredoxin